ncbi:MAG: hypothetical protein AVDCRST_MAG73-1572 [uncultured Thermomicrobiales bacterium]|uniref:Uncharacterized protein n=1 Tax=uncultured Thermomicrobiales bacterium TaxID=1645740 RepID=A0A6J4U0L4_9BACT|nr:MAG: hypothetical protein AVDCRST_MAG73-1572 [uncultured Thermomicrobiales bacterium]
MQAEDSPVRVGAVLARDRIATTHRVPGYPGTRRSTQETG